MTDAKLVVFAHGKESGPWGAKIQALAEVAGDCGYAVLSPDFSDLSDAAGRVPRLLEQIPKKPGELILVGSSMGGYVCLAASPVLKPRGLFLMAPAIGLPGYERTDPAPQAERTLIVHAWQDAIVPAANVIAFAQRHQTQLHLLDSDHRLLNVLPLICLLFREFLRAGEK
ncbi:alpha/beta fold hydrolase [Geoalkalibacter sp.]|uniref:alpha/beta fold hydrolase n=1 Tax=Geoalkalibacter sp. TaxID=3041440 RepID=UPI00272DCF69|nr:alpha/beta fold hydrolase [Geoalkalibacter sp.]